MELYRKPYLGIINRTAEEGQAAIEVANHLPRSAGGQGRGAGRAIVKATGEEIAILLRCNCEGGKFADGIHPGKDCPLRTREITTGICPAECTPLDRVYANQVIAEANKTLPSNARFEPFGREELESIPAEE